MPAKRSKRRTAANEKRAEVLGIFPTRMRCALKVNPTDWPRLTINAEFCLTGDSVFFYPNMQDLENRLTVEILKFFGEHNAESKGGVK